MPYYNSVSTKTVKEIAEKMRKYHNLSKEPNKDDNSELNSLINFYIGNLIGPEKGGLEIIKSFLGSQSTVEQAQKKLRVRAKKLQSKMRS